MLRETQTLMPITALVHEESAHAARVLRQVARGLSEKGLRLSGLLQSARTEAGEACAMVLENIATGREMAISEERGADAEGCSLVVGHLLAAAEEVGAGLDDAPDLLVLNKFGKTEGEGGGLRTLIARALERGIPILIAVPQAQLDNWRAFAGDYAVEIPISGENSPISDLIARFSAS